VVAHCGSPRGPHQARPGPHSWGSVRATAYNRAPVATQRILATSPSYTIKKDLCFTWQCQTRAENPTSHPLPTNMKLDVACQSALQVDPSEPMGDNLCSQAPPALQFTQQRSCCTRVVVAHMGPPSAQASDLMLTQILMQWRHAQQAMDHQEGVHYRCPHLQDPPAPRCGSLSARARRG
jgi:hypothetical protein